MESKPQCCANCKFALILNTPYHLICDAPLPEPIDNSGKSIYVRVDQGETCRAYVYHGSNHV